MCDVQHYMCQSYVKGLKWSILVFELKRTIWKMVKNTDFDQNGTIWFCSLRWTRLQESGKLFSWWNERMKTRQVYCVRMARNGVQVLSFLFLPSYHPRPVTRWTDSCNVCCMGLGTYTTTLIPFISSTQAVVVRFSVVKL